MDMVRNPIAHEEDESLKKAKLDELETAQKNAEITKKEIDEDFPILNGLAIIGIWAQLEVAVRDFVGAWILHNKSVLKQDAFQRLRVRVGEYDPLSRREKAQYLVQSLERDTASALKQGVGRFESLLEAIGLSGEVPEKLRKKMFELNKVRNLIAHTSGVVDSDFKASCPWFHGKIGERHRVSSNELTRYHMASIFYAMLIVVRTNFYYGVDDEYNTILYKNIDEL